MSAYPEDQCIAVLVYRDGKTLTVLGANGDKFIHEGVEFTPVALLHSDREDRKGSAAFTRVMVEGQV